MPKLRYSFILILIVLFTAGCNTHSATTPDAGQKPAPTGNSAVDSSKAQSIKDSLTVLATASDTFRVNTGRVFRMEKIAESQYEKALDSGKEKGFPPDSAAAVATEAAYLEASAGRVWRTADTLFFKTEQGVIIKLHDGPTYRDAEDSYEGYRFLENFDSIRQWLVEVGKWEGRYYLLVDQQTGKRTALISYPVISPDRMHFACANSSPTGYDSNGLQLWMKPQDAPPQLCWQRLSDSMRPGIAALNPRWENAKTLLFCEDFIIANRYMRIHL